MPYSVYASGQGIRIDHDGEPVGRWNIGHRHLVVYGTYAEAAPDRIDALCRHGFKPVPRPSGKSCWWRLPECELSSFRKAVEEMTGERIQFPR